MRKYNIGDYIMHESVGICKVNDIKLLSNRDNEEKEYYELLSIYQKGSKVTTPVENNDGRIRDIKSEEEINDIFKELPELEIISIKNNRAFGETVKSIVSEFEPLGLARILKTVYERKKHRLKEGKKTMSQDERILQTIGERLFEEMSFVLKKDKEDVRNMFFKEIDEIDKEL